MPTTDREIPAVLPRRRAGGPDALDRWTLRAALAALAVWSACLWVLAGRAFGCCWAGMVELAVVELAVVGAMLNLPEAVLRRALSLARRVLGGGRGVRFPRRLLAAGCAAAAAGGLASTGMIWAATAAIRGLGGMFLLPSAGWAVVRLLLGAAVMLPLASASAGLILAGPLLRRRGPGGARYELGGPASAGLALAAGLWWGGANLLGSALVCAVALTGLALAVVGRRAGRAALDRRVVVAARSRPRGPQRLANLCVWAAPAWLVTLQCRALRDVAGADWAGAWLWVAATAGLVVAVTARLGRRPHLSTAVDSAAAALGALLVSAAQWAMFAMALAPGRGAWLWVAAAGAGQIAFCALWADALARRRRAFAAGGPPGRAWTADAALGAAVGAGAALAMLACPAPVPVLGAAFLALTAMVVLRVARSAGRGASRPGKPPASAALWQRAGVGAAGVVAALLLVFGGARAVRRSLGPHVALGASLTAAQLPDGSVLALPAGVRAPRGALGALAGRLIRACPGRWWVISAGRRQPRLRPVEDAPDGPILVQWGLADRAFGRLPACRQQEGWADAMAFPRALAVGRRRFDGIYLSGLRADHPDAWCLYNRHVLARCLRAVGPGGSLIVHTGCGRGGLGALLAVAETFRRVAPAGYAVAATTPQGTELILVAGVPVRGGSLADLAVAAGIRAEVFALAELSRLDPPVDPVTLSTPRPRRRGAGWRALLTRP